MFENIADGATLSGTGWETTLPLSNMQDTRITKVARTTNLGTGNQTCSFDIDLGAFDPSNYRTYKAYDGIALINHSISPQGKIAIQCSALPDFSDQIGFSFSDAYVYTALMSDDKWSWSNPKFFSRRLSEIDLADYIRVYFYPIEVAQSNADRGVISSYGRYLRITITDTYSESLRNYIQIGRLFIGKRVSPTRDIGLGNAIRYQDTSIYDSSIGGELFFDRRPKKRIFTFAHPFLTKGEAFNILDMQRVSGVTGEILVVPDLDDAAYGFKRNFLGRMQETKEVVWALRNPRFETTYSIEEIL